MQQFLCSVIFTVCNKFQNSVNRDNGLLSLETCPTKKIQKDYFLEVVFPSGYAFKEVSHVNSSSLSPEDSTSDNSHDESHNTFVLNNYSHIFHTPGEIHVLNANCWYIKAYRLGKVDFETPSDGKKSFGWVAIHSAIRYEKRSVKRFFI